MIDLNHKSGFLYSACAPRQPIAEAVSAAISNLEDRLADPKFYERDPKGFGQSIAMLDKERETLAKLEEEWLELEMLREELEG